jgi:PhzF family phenazine biosynthesis protein
LSANHNSNKIVKVNFIEKSAMNTPLTIYQIDSFTTTPFRGNPAGVMLVDEQTSAEWMQKVAMEMNLSETAFLIPRGEKYRIRFFTPNSEMPLCGHATLASAHLIYALGLKDQSETVIFQAEKDRLSVRYAAGWLVMTFPRFKYESVFLPAEIQTALGFEPLALYNCDNNWKMAIAPDQTTLLQANPDFEALKRMGLGHLGITAKSDTADYDFVSRAFAPDLGINEDPVTGSIHCALAPYWAEQLGKNQLKARQLSARSGELLLVVHDQNVEIRGQAVTVFKADLYA